VPGERREGVLDRNRCSRRRQGRQAHRAGAHHRATEAGWRLPGPAAGPTAAPSGLDTSGRGVVACDTTTRRPPRAPSANRARGQPADCPRGVMDPSCRRHTGGGGVGPGASGPLAVNAPFEYAQPSLSVRRRVTVNADHRHCVWSRCLSVLRSARAVPRPRRIPGVGYGFQLFTAYSRVRSTWHLERLETSDRELVEPRVVDAEDALGVPGRDPIRVLVVEAVPPRVSQPNASTSARDSPRRTFFPADRSRPIVPYSATV
jgi:hypothetical protein